MNPGKYCHPGQCIFHLTKSHQSINCDFKKECDKLLQTKKSSSSASTSSSNSAGQLRHSTEEQDDSPVEIDELSDLSNDETPNDTNDDLLTYFSRVYKHYLWLVKSTLT